MRLCCVCVWFAHNERLRYPLTRAKCLEYRAALRADTTENAVVDKHSMTISPKEHLCPETSMSQRPNEAPGLAPCARRWKYDFSCNLTAHAACVQPARTQSIRSVQRFCCGYCGNCKMQFNTTGCVL